MSRISAGQKKLMSIKCKRLMNLALFRAGGKYGSVPSKTKSGTVIYKAAPSNIQANKDRSII